MTATTSGPATAGPVQSGIQRVFDEASTYYKDLRWEKNRLTRYEKEQTQRTLEEELGQGPFGSALEIGCGPGTWTGLLTDRAASVTAIDISPGMLSQARASTSAQNVQFVQADATTFEPDAKFDAVISCRVLEYIPERLAIVARLGELVAPGGRVVLVTKTPVSAWRGTGRERWFGPRRLYWQLRTRLKYGNQPGDFWQRHIPVRDMVKTLRAAGFVDIRIRPVIFGLPIFMRGTKQYPIVPEFAEAKVLKVMGWAWERASHGGAMLRRSSLLLSESYSISARLP